MKNYQKISLALLAFLAIMCFVAVVLPFIRGPSVYKPNPVRPGDFPAILIAPKDTLWLDHSTPSNGDTAPDTYALGFCVQDPYPSERTYRFIEEHLRSNGWQRLQHDLLNPVRPGQDVLEFHTSVEVPQYLEPEVINSLPREDKRRKEYPLKLRQEYWISKNDEHISVILYYAANLATRKVNREELWVNLSLFGRQRSLPDILRYKEAYPEEFQETKATGEVVE